MRITITEEKNKFSMWKCNRGLVFKDKSRAGGELVPQLVATTGGPSWWSWLVALAGGPSWWPQLVALAGGPSWRTQLAAPLSVVKIAYMYSLPLSPRVGP